MEKKENKNFFEKKIIKKKNEISQKKKERIFKKYLDTKSKWNFIKTEQLAKWSNEWASNFSEFDLVVGIPRSGLIPSSIIATKIAKPLTTIDFNDEKYWMSEVVQEKKEIKKIIIIDDSVASGKSIMEAKNKLKKKVSKNTIIETAAIIVTKDSKKYVDHHYKIIPQPRIFEWNLFHGKRRTTAFDMDGVLCQNCPANTDENEKKYLIWIKTVKPKFIPTFEIDFIITNRLEKYRVETENWLKKHNVKYKKLYMWNVKNKTDRQGLFAQNKINLVKKTDAKIVFESDFTQAKEIWEQTRTPVLCIDEMIFISE